MFKQIKSVYVYILFLYSNSQIFLNSYTKTIDDPLDKVCNVLWLFNASIAFFFIIMDDRNETKSHKPYMDSFREIKISTISHFSFKSGKHELIDVSLRYLHHISILLLLRELLVKIQFFRQCIAIFFTKQWMDIFYIT